MKKVDKVNYEEFLNLAKQCVDEQYTEDFTDYQEILDRSAEQVEKYQEREKIVQANSSSNATDLKRDQIKAAIENNGNLEIGKFTLKIRRAEGSKEKAKQKDGHLNISIYELGPDKLHRKVQVAEDNRFKDADWTTYFKSYYTAGQEVPIETVVEIIRWLQAVEKMLLFF